MTPQKKFRDLAIGETFDFIGENRYNSFSNPCRKISTRQYTDGKYTYRVGSIDVEVFHVGEVAVPEPTPKYVDTTWEIRSYDVWGNAKDGYEVNDTFRTGEVEIRCKVEVNNPDTPQQFLSAYPSDSQIRKALGLRRFKLELDGDDLTIYVNRARDSYPCGELYCTSHESLSPIRVKQ